MPKITRVSTPEGTRYLVSYNNVISEPFAFLSVAYLYILIYLELDQWEE